MNTHEHLTQTSKPPMKWFHFLIYFALFVAAFVNIINGLVAIAFAGSSTTAAGMKPILIIYAVIMFAMSIYAIVVRFFLAKFKSNAPTMLYIYYIIINVLNVILSIIELIASSASLMKHNSIQVKLKQLCP